MSNEKRLQQIRDAARYKYPDERIHFIDGAKWADSHPAWVSVNDELPKITIDGWRSEDVFFATDDGKSHFGFYSNKGVWFSSVYGFNGHQVTHWMPLPQPPVKKGGNDAS